VIVRLLVDENISRMLVQLLRQQGHDVVWVREDHRGLPDDQLLAIATASGRIVLTEDRDFGYLVIALRQPSIGVVIAEINGLPGTASEVANHVAEVVSKLGAAANGWLTVIEPGRVRQRKLPEP
jgi:predicted nuclease of predicted toxin-antitoxin system